MKKQLQNEYDQLSAKFNAAQSEFDDIALEFRDVSINDEEDEMLLKLMREQRKIMRETATEMYRIIERAEELNIELDI